MASSFFSRVFPPPAFLFLSYAGLEISDDAIRCIAYEGGRIPRALKTYRTVELPPGLVEGGDIRDEKKLIELLTALRRKEGLSYVKVSVPEEKMYLFQTTVPSLRPRAIQENIESKLEENVPLSAAAALFYFDILAEDGKASVSVNVSVVPRSYIERRISLLTAAGLAPVGFEVIPKAIASAVLSPHADGASLIVHFMKRKTGLYYILPGSIVGFTSTVLQGDIPASPADASLAQTSGVAALPKEIERVFAYVASREWPPVSRIMLSGTGAASYEAPLAKGLAAVSIAAPVADADIWTNIFSLDRYVPAIPKDESFAYAVAAGLALPA